MRPTPRLLVLIASLSGAPLAGATQINQSAFNFQPYDAGQRLVKDTSGYVTSGWGETATLVVAPVERDGWSSGATVYVDGGHAGQATTYLALVSYSPAGIFLGSTSTSVVTTTDPTPQPFPGPHPPLWERVLTLTQAQAPPGAYLALIVTLPPSHYWLSYLLGYTTL